MKYFRFTDAEIEQIKSLVADGLSTRAIAKIMKREYGTLSDCMRRNGIKTNYVHVQNSFSAEEVETIRAMVAAGVSAAKIGAALGRTRNSIIGKMDREGIKSEISSKKKAAPKTEKKREAKEAKEEKQAYRPMKMQKERIYFKEDIVVPASQRRGLIDRLDDQCCWPIGDPLEPGFHYCHHERDGKSSYCKHHAAKFRPVERPKKVSAWCHSQSWQGRSFSLEVVREFDEADA